MANSWFLVIATIMGSWLCSTGYAQTSRDLTWLSKDERQWLAEHPKLRLRPPPITRPLNSGTTRASFRASWPATSSISKEELGVEFELVKTQQWDENLNLLRTKQIDAVSLIVPWSDRDYVKVSKPYISYPSLIIVRKDEPKNVSLHDLAGKRVAVPNDYTGESFLRMSYPEIIIVEADGPAQGIRMLSTGEVDAYFGGASVVTYMAEREGITNLRIAGETDFVYANGFGVREDWQTFAEIVSKTLDRMTPAQHRAFHAEWITGGFFQKRFYEYRRFWWIMGAVLTALVFGTGTTLIWNRKQAALIDQLEAAKQQTDAGKSGTRSSST